MAEGIMADENAVEGDLDESNAVEQKTATVSTAASNDEYFLETLEDIYGALRKIILMQQPVSITIEGSDEHYTSAITNASLKHSSFFLDKVVPDSGNELIRSGSRFSGLADSQGVKIEFNMTGRIKYQPSNEQYRVEFPTQVLYLQRRTAYRVMISPAHKILVKLKMEDGGDNLIGQLADLSSSGFKAIFKGDSVERLQNNSNIAVARIKFNEQNNMDCSLIARHVVGTQNGNTQVGFAFNIVSGMGQRYLDRLIGELQWEERQRAEQAELNKLKNNEQLPNLQD